MCVLLVYHIQLDYVIRQILISYTKKKLFVSSSSLQAAIAKKFFPLLDRVLIQRAESLTKTASGLVIPEKSQAKVLHGTVVAVGPGGRNQAGEHVPLAIKAGDTVLLPEYGGQKVEIDDNEFHLFREADILAKVQKN